MRKTGDIILLLTVTALLVIAALPEKKPEKSIAEPGLKSADVTTVMSDKKNRSLSEGVKDNLEKTLSALESHRVELDRVNTIARSQGGPVHRATESEKYAPFPTSPGEMTLMPLTAGSVWKYDVFGDEKLATAQAWIYRIISAPTEGEPGTASVRFGDAAAVSTLHKQQGAIRIDALPFIAPIELDGSHLDSNEGELLPPQVRMVDGAVWNEIQRRSLIYAYTDKKGSRHELNAAAVIRNRAHVKGFETVTVPAGHFGAFRVEWITRVEIEAAGRPILEHLTTEPYRKESMWVSPGIGIVKRKVDYLKYGRKDQSVTLSLVQFTPAQKTARRD